ncbi:hypothetical protein [Consotaella salsifontis]|uniref:Uncharacterized protein n=1 Tax=Consotaella salsifontis TaxID=1365950 RepID=A0A1T4LUD9_9HYPH|nr:hypothetical protein [Consotaella salsifontis]SJZ58074.1 hypothetical protein SAMN05428963_101360 [Consotaella salsifontis]
MFVFALSLTMAAALVSATAITLHSDLQRAKVKATIRKHQLMR